MRLLHRSISTLWLPVMSVAIVVAVGSCGSDDSTRPRDPAAGANGQQLYAAACASCHGGDLRGSPVGPSQLSEVYEPGHHSDASYRAAIENGAPAHHWDFGPMPAFPGLTEEQVTAVIAYIREVQQEEGFEPYPPD